MTLHVYAGPSLDPSLVPADPALRLHPPVAHGDLYRLRPEPGDAVLVVDGVYQHRPPVRHKEILSLCADAIPVYGAASIGALRAAELSGHGMAGLGTVFGWYADGRLESDADVALLHGDDEAGFRPLTEALVSVIGVVDRLERAGLLEAAAGADIVELARSLHFTARTRAALRAAARAHGRADQMDLVLSGLAAALGDVKRADAVQAIRELLARHPGDRPAEPAAAPDTLNRVPDTSYRREWRLAHTPAGADPDGPTLRQVLAYAQLFLPDYPDRHTSYVLDRVGWATPAPDGQERPELWLSGLSPAELVERGLLAADEAASLTPEARAVRVLVRSFRLRPGRLVYERIPAVIGDDRPELTRQCSRMLDLSARTVRANPSFHPADIPAQLVDSAFRALWEVDDLALHVLDRGFRDLEDFRLNARPFFVAARAAVNLRGAGRARTEAARA